MEIHPWTNYEIARMRDEERLKLAREAMRSLEARSSEPEPDGEPSPSAWLGRIRRREPATTTMKS
jgi:hypothetical protein